MLVQFCLAHLIRDVRFLVEHPTAKNAPCGQLMQMFIIQLIQLEIYGFHIYRAFAKTKGIPLLLDDATAAQLMQPLAQLRQPTPNAR